MGLYCCEPNSYTYSYLVKGLCEKLGRELEISRKLLDESQKLLFFLIFNSRFQFPAVLHVSFNYSKISKINSVWQSNGREEERPNPSTGPRPRGSITLREESTGKKHGNVNSKTMCNIDHLKDLALWAAAEASFPSLGTFFGERLAATNEALGLRGDPSTFVCERCESILQPGNNCSVGIEKKRLKGRHRRKGLKANIVYRCQFCCHQNMMRGTPKGYVKEISPPKPKPSPNLKKVQENHPSAGNAATAVEVDSDSLLPFDGQNPETRSPTTPLPKTGVSLLDSRRRKRNRSGAKKVDETQICSAAADMEKSVEASSKTRKKSWTSLKEIAESSGKKFTDLTVPFFICVTV